MADSTKIIFTVIFLIAAAAIIYLVVRAVLPFTNEQQFANGTYIRIRSLANGEYISTNTAQEFPPPPVEGETPPPPYTMLTTPTPSVNTLWLVYYETLTKAYVFNYGGDAAAIYTTGQRIGSITVQGGTGYLALNPAVTCPTPPGPPGTNCGYITINIILAPLASPLIGGLVQLQTSQGRVIYCYIDNTLRVHQGSPTSPDSEISSWFQVEVVTPP